MSSMFTTFSFALDLPIRSRKFRRRNSRQKFPTLIEISHVFYDYATWKGMVKPHVNKSVQYMKLIGNQSLFHMMVHFYFGVE